MMHPALDEVKAWILARNPELPDISPYEDLIEGRLVRSLGLMEFLALLERLSGRTIDIGTLHIDDIRSLHSINRALFSESTAPLP
ncbi:acyl carrier protein [Sphaerisporangium sp. TRM90804]|uniref:acyl carrier protein n=1 Tax=Sphaerisporangium sp. TRM90804 TaxID=3031113 RepID=UPI00244CA179|nr:acyl carrier protein [Sphaerisporangium sp. TRM90804]MDH2428026.1 acyl carrier protein [Sphaerisporangium sp. TRM90804]